MSVNSEPHILGLWLGGGVTPAALRMIEAALRKAENDYSYVLGHDTALRTELLGIANACHAQLTKLPKPDPARYL